jgi:transposase
VDTGYVKAEYLVSSRNAYGIDLLGPTRTNTQWQARLATGFSVVNFKIDWEAQTVLCPAGNNSQS